MSRTTKGTESAMRITLRRTGAIGLAAAVVAGLTVVGADVANAAVIGSLTGSPASGSVSTPFGVIASSLCPDGTDGLSGVVNSSAAPGWSEIQVITNDTEIPNLNTTGVAFGDTLSSIAAANSLTLANGTYDVRLDCKSGFVDVLGSFTASFTVTGTSYAFEAAPAPASTTVLAVTPSSPQNIDTPLTLTATVTSTATVAGTVQFKDGTTNLGTPVAVTAGSASLTTSSLTGGSHTLTAEFIPTSAASIAGSTSNAVPFTIDAPAQATTTTLSSGPAAPTTADVVSLTATVTPASAIGTVAFKEGTTTVGTATLSGGVAAVSLTGLSAGTHTYTADFTPANVANFLASSADEITVEVGEFAGVQASENITTTVSAGTLTITAGLGTLDLGTPVINASNTLLVTAPKDINPVTVTDTRAGNLGWNVNGVVGDFVSASDNKINSENLGWTPKVIDSQAGQNVTAGAAVAPGSGVAVGAGTGAGLKTARTLGSASAGGSLGTAQLGASLVLQAPTTTLPDTYNTVLTLTAV